MFQSPKSGEFESDLKIDLAHGANREPFQSPRSGKFESNMIAKKSYCRVASFMFQSPRSGKFESNKKLVSRI